ncbi:MAG TPA: hypothetical protein VKN99_04855 [Polyangia bacterium]|nr:hypothetical protein [Polyangia bacterium]
MTRIRPILLVLALGISGLGVAVMARASSAQDEPPTYRTLDRMIKQFAADARAQPRNRRN